MLMWVTLSALQEQVRWFADGAIVSFMFHARVMLFNTLQALQMLVLFEL